MEAPSPPTEAPPKASTKKPATQGRGVRRRSEAWPERSGRRRTANNEPERIAGLPSYHADPIDAEECRGFRPRRSNRRLSNGV